MSKIGKSVLSSQPPKMPKNVVEAYLIAENLNLSDEEIDLIKKFNLRLTKYNARKEYNITIIDQLLNKDIIRQESIERETRGYRTSTNDYYKFTEEGKKLREGLKYQTSKSFNKPTLESKILNYQNWGGKIFIDFRKGELNIQDHELILGKYDAIKIENAEALIKKDHNNSFEINTSSLEYWEPNTSKIDLGSSEENWIMDFIEANSLRIDVRAGSPYYAVDKDTLSLLRYMDRQNEILTEISKTIPPTISPQRLRKVLESAKKLI